MAFYVTSGSPPNNWKVNDFHPDKIKKALVADDNVFRGLGHRLFKDAISTPGLRLVIPLRRMPNAPPGEEYREG
jgi:hypothetical protein